MTAGQEFVKKIRPAGVALFLLIFILYLIICFTSRPDPLAGYEAPHNSTYYAQSDEALGELKAELEANVFPKLAGDESCTVKDGKLEIVTGGENFNTCRSAILKHFDAELFEFIRS